MGRATGPADPLTIGELSAATRVSIETIRYYEREGLLPKPSRSVGGRRQYGQADALKLRFLRRCRELGFSLLDARMLASLADRETVTCAEVKAVVTRHRLDINAKLRDLRRLERALASIETSCPGSDDPRCPILETLSKS